MRPPYRTLRRFAAIKRAAKKSVQRDVAWPARHELVPRRWSRRRVLSSTTLSDRPLDPPRVC